jgi:hypothetical protein
MRTILTSTLFILLIFTQGCVSAVRLQGSYGPYSGEIEILLQRAAAVEDVHPELASQLRCSAQALEAADLAVSNGDR